MRAGVYGLVLGTLIPLMPVIACSGDSGSGNGPLPPEGPEVCVPLTFLGSLAGSHSVATAINATGWIAGYSALPDLGPRATLWVNEMPPRDLGTLGGPQSQALDLNEAGEVVGHSDTADGHSHAFRWHDGVMTDLGTLGGGFSAAYGINDEGQIVGVSTTAHGHSRAFLWQNGVMADLGTLGGTSSQARAINGRGQIVGASDLPGDTVVHAFLWQNGTMADLGTLYPDDVGDSRAFGINATGQVVGRSYHPRTDERAFLWESGTMRSLFAVPDAAWSSASAISDAGDIVGFVADLGPRAFLWNGGGLVDLASFPGIGTTLSEARDINAAGLGVGFSDDDVPGGVAQAVLWDTRCRLR